MIEIDAGGVKVPLDEVILASESVPINIWGDSTAANIRRAINYLKSVGGGSIKVPANEEYNLLVIKVLYGRDRLMGSSMLVKYEYSDWRPPNTIVGEDGVTVLGEYRPYTSEPWQAGDIIRNSDMEKSDDKVVEWYCTMSGTSTDPSGIWRFVSAGVQPGSGKRILYSPEEEKLTVMGFDPYVGKIIRYDSDEERLVLI